MANSNTQMYGCDINEFMESVRESGTDYLMAAMSQLSDAQELMNGGDVGKELARQAINRAKFMISDIRYKVGREKMEDLSQ